MFEYSQEKFIVLVTIYGILSSITTFDTRLIQAKREGVLPADEQLLPRWVAVLYWVEWMILIFLLILNWKFGLIVYLIRFILKVLPVLEIIGNVLMAPFKKRK